MKSGRAFGTNRQSGEIVTIIVIIVVLIGLVFGGYKLIGVAADAMADYISDETEANLFGGIAKKQAGWNPDPTTDQHKRCAAIFQKLLKAEKLRKLKYKMYYMNEKTPNAFALPGGSMAVTDGLLKLVEGDVGLAMVIGHEFGHQQYRHSLRQMGRSLLLAGVMMLVVGDAGFLVSLAVDLAQKSHSREQELEADSYGVKMIKQVFGTTKGALEFFQKIDKDGKSAGGEVMSMFSTHPYTPDRIEKLKAMMVELDGAEALESAPPTPKPEPKKKAPAKQKKAEKK